MEAFAENLDEFLSPRSIALVGASDAPGKPGHSLFEKVRGRMKETGGAVFPVNPRLAEIDGIRCYPSVAAIGEPIDVAVVMVGDALGALEECVQAKVRYVIVFTAGFSETGPEGARLERTLLETAQRGGVRLFGPNTNVNVFETFLDLPGPKVALLTQSGHQGRPIVQGESLGIGFRRWVPTGNEVDLEMADFIRHFADDSDTGAIACYVEGFRHGEKLKRAADYAAHKRKPIIVVKVGRSPAGERMALAHTGHLAGSDAVHDAVFRQYGMVRVEDLDELVETAGLFTLARSPAGGRICVYAISGGTGALAADLLGAAGLALPELDADIQRRLRELIPSYLTVRNPVDNGAAVLIEGCGPKIFDILLADPSTDLVFVPITGVLPPISEIFAREVVEAHRSGRKPIVTVWGSPKTDDPAFRRLVEGRVPVFRSIRNAVRALRAFLGYSSFARAYESPFGTNPVVSVGPDAAIDGLLAGSGPLTESESKQVLARYGVPVTREKLCRSAAEAVAAAREIGFPVALKASSRAVAHKSDAGLVRLGLGDESAVARAFAEIGRDDGVLVQEMVAGGREVIVGATRDPQFGPVVVFGLGGVFAEALGDVAMRSLPIGRRDAEAMVREIRGFRVLETFRGRPPADVEAIADVILRVAALAEERGDRIAELDINPLMVLDRGRGAVAADALIVRG